MMLFAKQVSGSGVRMLSSFVRLAVTRSCVLVSSLSFLLACAVPSAFAAVRLEAPEIINPGQPFVVTLIADEPLQNVVLEWRGKKLELPVSSVTTEQGYALYAKALLGLPLSEDSSSVPLQVRAFVSGVAHTSSRTLKVQQKKYPEQRLTVKKKYVDIAKNDLERHKKERERVNAVLASITPERYWDVPMQRPVPGSVSSVFGLRRFFNDQPRKPHTGVDLRGAEGTPILSCADGVVALAENHFFSGNAVFIDHGEGVVSMYFHMSRIDVVPGQQVKKGEAIGAVGSTGRVTGPHLHFGLSLQGVSVDPMPLFE
ncbi:M23 family metallopeptidase [Oleidesulfovibrio sp.]|uniref:M23 family metallopeptidase n=1 Tax=Oleidesulfovibrio sp. TaxID=2909707 RepID=UPI003A84A992